MSNSIIHQITYSLPDHKNELWLAQQGPTMYDILYEVDQRCRDIIKYEENCSNGRIELAEEIRQMINTQINLYNLE